MPWPEDNCAALLLMVILTLQKRHQGAIVSTRMNGMWTTMTPRCELALFTNLTNMVYPAMYMFVTAAIQTMAGSWSTILYWREWCAGRQAEAVGPALLPVRDAWSYKSRMLQREGIGWGRGRH